MGHADVIWQGDANEQALRLLAHCTTPATPINITGPVPHQHPLAGARNSAGGWAASREFSGTEAPTAWLEDTTQSQRLFGKPAVPLDRMIDWVADWVSRGQPSLGKPTHFSTRDGKY